MNQPKIPAVDLKAQHEAIRAEMETAVRTVFDLQDFVLGEEVLQLEGDFARLHGCTQAVGCASGSDALLLSLMALGVGPGDAVLVPAFTFFATASSVVRLGARPIFVDIDPRTFNISTAAVDHALREDPPSGVRALIAVHLYGQSADMDGLMELASKYDLALVEDCAQAVLARSQGKSVGSFGKTGCFSFYPTKNLSGAGDGGMITTRDPDFAAQLRLLRNHGSADKREFSLLGINSRLDTLQAAVLLVKLWHLEEWTRRRQQKAAAYRKAFAATGLTSPDAVYPSKDAPLVLPHEAAGMDHVYHQFTVRVRERDKLSDFLQQQGIGTAVYYPVPLHRQPVFERWAPSRPCVEAERAAAEVLSLPIYPELTEAQLGYVVEKVCQYYSSSRKRSEPAEVLPEE